MLRFGLLTKTLARKGLNNRKSFHLAWRLGFSNIYAFYHSIERSILPRLQAKLLNYPKSYLLVKPFEAIKSNLLKTLNLFVLAKSNVSFATITLQVALQSILIIVASIVVSDVTNNVINIIIGV